MSAPAAVGTAAAGLGLTVAEAIATVSLPTDKAMAGHDPAGHRSTIVPRLLGEFAAVGRALTGAVRILVIRGDTWALPTPVPLPAEQTAVTATTSPDVGGAGEAGAWLAPAPPAHDGPPDPTGPQDPAEAVERQLAQWQAAISWLSARADLVTIAAVRGPASGLGLALALACDLRVLSEDASYELPQARTGLVPALGVTGALAGLLGYPRALDLCLTGRALTAAEALAVGAADRVVPAASLDQAVADLTSALLAVPRQAAAETKALLRGARDRRPADQLAAERAALARCLAADPAG
ncbi:MAG: enoyl-CoA hydratase/isomerase family protein [Frankia sp.]|nr:enoyl-CoA hydratase/isomerase family protein [Frankia sp.]